MYCAFCIEHSCIQLFIFVSLHKNGLRTFTRFGPFNKSLLLVLHLCDSSSLLYYLFVFFPIFSSFPFALVIFLLLSSPFLSRVPCRSDVSYTRIDKSIVFQQEGPGICCLLHPSRPRSLPATLSEFLLTIPNLSLSGSH